jgi:hypothetical protein
MRILLVIGLLGLAAVGAGAAANDRLPQRGDGGARQSRPDVLGEIRSLDGSGNNVDNADWGQAYTPYSREPPANYADGVSSMTDGPDPPFTPYSRGSTTGSSTRSPLSCRRR